MKAQSFLNAFGRLWPFVEVLHDIYQDSFFSYQELKECLLNACEKNSETPSSIAQQLLKHQIITTQPRNKFRYEIEPQMLDFIEVIKRETKLSFVDEYIAYIEHTKETASYIGDLFKQGKLAEFERRCATVDRLLRTMIYKLQNDTSAVEKIALKAKAANKKLPVKLRYQQVLETWDNFLSPVIAQAQAGGELDRVAGRIESELMAILTNDVHKEILGKRSRDICDNLLARILDLREALRSEITSMQNALVPLVNEVRINTQNTKGAAKALQLIAKNGLKSFSEQYLKGFQKRRSHAHFGDVDDIKSIIHDVSSHQDEQARITLLNNRAESTRNTSFSYKDVVAALKTRKNNVADVLGHILNNNPDIETHQALTSICHIHRDPDLSINLIRGSTRIEYLTRTHKIEMPAYQLQEK